MADEGLVGRVRDHIHPGGCACLKCAAEARAILREVADAVEWEDSTWRKVADWIRQQAEEEG